MGKRGRVALAVVVAVLLLAAMFALGVMVADDEDATGVDGAPKTGDDRVDASGSATSGDATNATNATSNVTSLTGAARSVLADATVEGLDTISLDGADVSVSGEVAVGGRGLGRGTLEATGGRVKVNGRMRLDTSGLLVRTNLVAFDGTTELLLSGDVAVEAPSLRFNGRPIEGTSAVVRDEPTTASVTGELVAWADAPGTLDVRSTSNQRATLSWAGQGEIVPAASPDDAIRAGYLGVKGTALDVRLVRTGELVSIQGKVRATQVYADGQPKLAATGGVDVKRPPKPVASGGQGQFSWAPTNTGDTDLVISAVRAGSPQARWVRLALDRHPRMCGGEAPPACPHPGGVADGFDGGDNGFLGLGRAKPINAVIIPGTGDERDITFNVPAGTPAGRYEIVVVFEGNFPAVTVRIPFDVTA